jgi:hypothetical protein
MTNDANGVSVRKSEEPLELILRASGYEDARLKITPNNDKTFPQSLTAVKTKGADRPRPPKHTPNKTGGDTKNEPKKTEPSDDGGIDEELKNPFSNKGG